MDSTPVSLLERLRTGPDEASWRRLFDLYTLFIRRWLESRGMPASDVDDLAQEVCAVVARELPEFHHSGRPGAFRLWVRTIALNRLRAYWRTRRTGQRWQDGQDLDRLADPDDQLSTLWDRDHDLFVVRRLMELIEPEFAPSTWQAFRRQAIDEQPAARVAVELGLSVNAVLIAKSRVLRRLRIEGRGLIEGLEDVPGPD
jgi:RNA polymerase sigma-70 factor (ECF subfamily)